MKRAICNSSIIQNGTVTCSNICLIVAFWIVGALFVGLSYISISLNPRNTTYEQVDYGFSIAVIAGGSLCLLVGCVLLGVVIARYVSASHRQEAVNPYKKSYGYGTNEEAEYDDL